MSRSFVPDVGDLIWLTLDPQAGHEQSGRRPALVLSPATYNHRSGLALVCPITSRVKGYPFEVPLPDAANISGVVLADQIRSLAWRSRRAKKAGRAAPEVMAEVLARIAALINL